jgi:glycosyltransferase 2 family protein
VTARVTRAAKRALRLAFDWRLWVGVALPLAAIAYTVHDVDLRQVVSHIGDASPWWVAAMVPMHILGLWLRAVRWRWLARSLSRDPLPIGPLFRATALGFMAINVLPFRLGELARPWLLGRETEVRGSAALGTLVLERAIDFTAVSLMGGVLLFLHTKALPSWVRTGAFVFLLFTFIPLAAIAALRVNEEGTLSLLAGLLRPFPDGLRERALGLVTEMCRGLAGLRGFHATAQVVFQTAVLWGVVLPAPFLFGLLAFDVDLPLRGLLLATFTANIFVALAIAAPSAPGFFGVFHFACREALHLFAVPTAVAVAYGTVVHMTYWLPVTLIGGVVAAQTGARFAEIVAPGLGKAPSGDHR